MSITTTDTPTTSRTTRSRPLRARCLNPPDGSRSSRDPVRGSSNPLAVSSSQVRAGFLARSKPTANAEGGPLMVRNPRRNRPRTSATVAPRQEAPDGR